MRIPLLLLILVPLTGGAGPQVARNLAFSTLVRNAQTQCPESKIHRTTPAALLAAEQSFRDRLPFAQKEAVRTRIPRTADGTPQQCAVRDDASCRANAELEAIWKAGLIRDFATQVCARGAAPWR